MLNNKKEAREPYKVFMTEEEWREAVAAEAQKMQENTGEESVEDIKSKLLLEAQKIKERVPDFDFKKMLSQDPEFRERILKGYSIEEAFYLSNRKKAEEPVPKKRIGIRENGKGSFMGAPTSRNVAHMSDAEFKKYIDSIKGSKF